MKSILLLTISFLSPSFTMAMDSSCEKERTAIRDKYSPDGKVVRAIVDTQTVMLRSAEMAEATNLRAVAMADLSEKKLTYRADENGNQQEKLYAAGVRLGESSYSAKKKFCASIREARSAADADFAGLRKKSCLNEEVEQSVQEALGKYQKIYESCCVGGWGVADPICS